MPSTENSRTAEIAAKVANSKENTSVPWQNGRQRLRVINLSINSVVLNPMSHRIRAQIESHPEAGIFKDDPFSDRAQEIIDTILAETAGFEALADSLNENGQLEPGIITHTGVLVNGNTRAVALRRLGQGYIRVGVLRDGATEKEITDLEARLQLVRELKQDYTLTNELLFIKEQLDGGTSVEDLALLLGKAQSRSSVHLRKGVAEIEKSVRILQHIREIQHVSRGAIPLVFFDPHESALAEADRVYIKFRDGDPEQARRVRDGRIAGVLVGVTYRNLRNWDSDDFLRDHVEPQFDANDDSDLLALVREQPTQDDTDDSSGDDGLAVLDQVSTPLETDVDPSLLLTAVASHFGDTDNAAVTVSGLTKAQLFEDIKESITQAAEERAQEKRDERRLSTPIKLLRDARQKVNRARDALTGTSLGEGFKQGKFNYELRKLRKAVDELVRVNDSDT